MSILMRALERRYMDQAPAGDGAPTGGGSAPAAPPPPAAAPAGTGTPPAATPPAAGTPPAATPPATPPAGEPSLLSQGKTAAELEAVKNKPGAPASTDWIPEKYRVMEGEEGKKALNVEASMRKVAEAHAALERRAGELGLPPEKPADYKVTLPEGSTLKMEDLEGPQLDRFKEAAHKAGMTPKQFEAAAAAHLQGMNDLVLALTDRSAAMAKSELEADPEWQGANLNSQLKLAFRTFNAFATPEEAKEIDRIGNNPVFLKVLARVGKDLGEDRLGRGSGAAAVVDETTLSEYMKAGGPYWDATHPDHKKYVDVVTRHHQAKFGTKAIAASGHG